MSERATQFHANPWLGAFYITGGGTQLISELMTTPGASKTVLEVQVPYANQALTELVGGQPDQASSQATARMLAMAAYQRARDLAANVDGEPRLFGYACTASLATDRIKRGAHRAHLAVQTGTLSISAELSLAADRATEETQLLEAQWALLGRALNCTVEHQANQFTHIYQHEAPPTWQALINGEKPAVAVSGVRLEQPKLLLPGSFNPYHAGHQEMMACAEAKLDIKGAFELSVANVDKPMLDYLSIQKRLAHFDDQPLWLTALPTFREKARIFPGVTFIVGADTITRIAATKYYDGTADRNHALKEFVTQGVKFLVFGRKVKGKFKELHELRLPKMLREICIEVSEEEFRRDLSSTALRREQIVDTKPS